MYRRLINLPTNHSFFLLGPRGTGKSTLLETTFLRQFTSDQIAIFDLLDPDVEEELKRRPARLRERLDAQPQLQWVVIDEVQKLPGLLDVVHQLIESRKLHFALTGSSARKLKRGGANLLAGRAFDFKFHPLTHVWIEVNLFDVHLMNCLTGMASAADVPAGDFAVHVTGFSH